MELIDIKMEELELMFELTKKAELLGFKIKDKLYLDDGRYYGKIFRFFSDTDAKDFLNSNKKTECSDFFINAFESMGKGYCQGKFVDGQIIWEK